MPQDFTEEQKQYLEGFVSGCNLARTARGLPTFAGTVAALGIPPGVNPGPGAPDRDARDAEPPAGPDARMCQAQDRFLAEGKKLAPEELAKRKRHPLDIWDDLRQHAREGRFPRGTDVLAFKYHGLFYVAPAQDAYMCRLRFPCGILSAYQMRRVADLAESYGGACADVTTRANLQIRDIYRAEHATEVLTALQEAGILIQGSGADNIRNITGTPTAGIDPQELIDTRPLCRELNAYILHHRDLYGLPRKFNIAFDGGGTISALADTNDVGFAAVRVGANRAVPSGVYFRMELGGITGHGDFARDTGVLLESEECVPMAAAVARVFIEHGDRTDRKKARLKYLLDRWGIERYMAEVRKHLAFEPVRFPLDECEPRGPVVKHGHIGIRPQRQEGLFYAGVVLPAGRLQSDAMRGLAQIAERHGSATIRLTVWQNLLISDIPAERIPAVQQEIEALGLHWRANMVRGGLVACTGNGGCRFAASDTKRHALAIAAHLEARFGDPSVLDQPVNIHLTGCPNSCAQHYLGDLGFLGTKVEAGDELVEGYHVYAGGGYGEEQSLGREIARGVPAPEAPLVAERLLAAYLEHRQGPTESFRAFTQRHSTTQLQSMLEAR